MNNQLSELKKTNLKPNIAYLTGFYARVGDTFIRREVEELRHLGWNVSTFSIRRADSSEQVSEDILREQASTFYILEQGKWKLGLSCIKMALTHPLRMVKAIQQAQRIRWPGAKSLLWHLFYLIEACSLAEQLIKRDIALIHNHIAMSSGTVALLASKLADIPFSLTVHGPHEFFNPEHWGLGAKIAASSLTVCISHFGKSQCMLFSPPGCWHKLQVVHCGLDNLFLKQAISKPKDSRKLIFVGRLDPEKGLLILVDAAAQVKQKGIEFELLIVGGGELRADIEEHVKKLRLQDNIKFLGWRGSEDVRQLITDSRAMILPSFAEGIPVVLMESLALERPVISSYVAGIPELVVNGETGWLVPPGSVDELASVMITALQASPQALAKMGKAGRQYVLKEHAITSEAKKLSDLFANLL